MAWHEQRYLQIAARKFNKGITVIICTGMISISQAYAERLAPVGTLTCTAKRGHQTASGVWKDLDCSLQRTGFPTARLDGTITKLGQRMSGRSRQVLIWIIQSQSSDFEPKEIEGKYVRKAPARGSTSVLVNSNGVRLVPTSHAAQAARSSEMTILELQLISVKV